MIRVMARAENKAEILIHEPIGENWYGDGLTSKRFVDDLKALGNVSEILVRINSPGGAVFDGIAIYNALKEHPATVDVLVEGLAASAASAIAMAGDRIRMGDGAMLMIHNPWTMAAGDADDMRSVADMLDQVSESLISIYQKRTGLDRAEIAALLDAETWLTAEEAVARGFATAAEQPAEEEAATAAAYVQKVTAYQRAAAVFNAATRKVPPQRLPAAASQSAPADATQETMTMKTPAIDAVSASGGDASSNEAARAAVLAAEKARRAGVRAAFGKFAEAHRALLDQCLENEAVGADAARELLLAKIAESATPLASHVEITADGRDKFAEGVSRALLARVGVEKREAGNEFNGASLSDIAGAALSRNGISVRGMSRDQIARKVLASHTSSDFPLLLSNTAGKVLRTAYTLAPVTWNRWARIGQVSDFKVASRHTLGSFSSLVTKPERAEYQQGSMTEEREPIQAITKGRYLSLSREMIVNDDLNAFVDASRRMGRAAARTIEADVYALLTSASGAGPTMSDTGAFFNSTVQTTAGGHANLAASGTAITVQSIAAGEAAMLAQRDRGLQDFLALSPRFLVCSPARKQIAWETINSLTDVSQSNSAKRNYVQAQLNLEVLATPYLSGNGWYLFSDPADAEAFEVAFLDGVQEPFIDEEVEFMTDAMNMKVRLDYAVAAIDWRAGYRNPGA